MLKMASFMYFLCLIVFVEMTECGMVPLMYRYDCSGPSGCVKTWSNEDYKYPYLLKREMHFSSTKYIQTVASIHDRGFFSWFFDIRVSDKTPIADQTYWYTPLQFCVTSNKTFTFACYPIQEQRSLFRAVQRPVFDDLDFKIIYGLNLETAFMFNRTLHLFERRKQIDVVLPRNLLIDVVVSVNKKTDA